MTIFFYYLSLLYLLARLTHGFYIEKEEELILLQACIYLKFIYSICVKMVKF